MKGKLKRIMNFFIPVSLTHLKPTWILAFTLSVFLLAPVAIFAQDETEIPADQSTGEIVFTESEDSSLFVSSYRLNAGDTIKIEIISDAAMVYEPMLDDDGFIVVPVLGRLKVSELTLGEARQFLQNEVDKYFRQAWVSVRITKLGKVKFYVYGDLSSPGFYQVNSSTTFYDFLQAFKFSTDAGHRRIVHVKGDASLALPERNSTPADDGETTSELINKSLQIFKESPNDYKSLLDPRVTILDPLVFTVKGRIEEENFYLGYGDVIYIADPEIAVYVSGFRRSGYVEILPGENLTDVIRIAGAPNFASDISNMVLERRNENGQISQLYYNLNLLNTDQLASIPVQNRDFLKILPYPTEVFVVGEVKIPGVYPYDARKNVLEYLASAGGETSDAHLRVVTVVRPNPAKDLLSAEGEVFTVDVVDSILKGKFETSFALQPGDIIYVPAKGENITFNTVISGLSFLVNAIRLFD